jgi:hypothetical protein
VLYKKLGRNKGNQKVDTTEDPDKDDEYINVLETNTVTDMNNGRHYHTEAPIHTTNHEHRLIVLKKPKIMVTDHEKLNI